MITSIIGGIAFLHPVTSLQNLQLPALAVLGFFSLALGTKLLRLDRKTTPVGLYAAAAEAALIRSPCSRARNPC